MSAVSELKTAISIRDNMSAGLKSIQKEQLRLKKEVQETKEVLKDTFGKKWSVKLQSIELLRYLRELGNEIRRLRKQLARMLQGDQQEKPVLGAQITIKSSIAEPLIEKHTIEKHIVEKNIIVQKSSEKGGNKYEIMTSSGESLGSKLVGDVSNKLISKGTNDFINKALDFIGKSIGIEGTTGPLLLAIGAIEEIKYVMKDLNEIELAGVAAEQQDLYMERAIKISDPSRGTDEVKKQRDEYMKLLRSNSEEAGFKPSEVLDAGDSAVKIAGGDIGKAIEIVRVAEEMTVSNPGSTLAESMEALNAAKAGNIEGLKSFGVQVSYEELGNIGFEGIVQQKLKTQFVGGIEKHRNSDAGVMAAEEAYQENSKQKSGRVLLENKRKDERKKADETRRIQEYRKMDINEKVQQFKDIDGQHKRLPKKGTGTIQSENQMVTYELTNELTAEKMMRRLAAPTKAAAFQSNSGGLAGGNNKASNMAGAYEVSKVNLQSSKPNIQNQAFTININGVNKSTNEIMSEMIPQLKLALQNMSAKVNGHSRVGGALA